MIKWIKSWFISEPLYYASIPFDQSLVDGVKFISWDQFYDIKRWVDDNHVKYNVIGYREHPMFGMSIRNWNLYNMSQAKIQ